MKIETSFQGVTGFLKQNQGLIQTLVAALAASDPVGKLWVVEPGRVREHTNEE